MEHQHLTICESASYGVHILSVQSNLTRLLSAWHSLKSQDSKKRHTITIRISMQLLTWQSPTKSPQRIGMTWMLVENKNFRIWCDYCKVRFGTQSMRGQTTAVWTVKSERNDNVRHYCHDCLKQVQHWACPCADYKNCKNVWLIGDQLEYANHRERLTLDV